MTDSIKMTISASIALYETIDKFLYDENKVERKVPFSVKYKLLRDITQSVNQNVIIRISCVVDSCSCSSNICYSNISNCIPH